MQIGIFETAEEASVAAARAIVDLFARTPGATLGVATGSTPEGLYSQLRKAHSNGLFTLENSSAFALDEYVGIEQDHPERYRNVLRRELVGPNNLGLTEAGLHTPDGSADHPSLAAEQYEASIAAAGGVDVQILGIGANGHIGFNEPGGSLVSQTRVEVLSGRTRTDNARFFGGNPMLVPSRCITQGLGTIMRARSLLLLAFGPNKAEAVRQLIEGPISAKWPATIAQMHPNLNVFVDAAAAEGLEYADLYRERWSLA